MIEEPLPRHNGQEHFQAAITMPMKLLQAEYFSIPHRKSGAGISSSLRCVFCFQEGGLLDLPFDRCVNSQAAAFRVMTP